METKLLNNGIEMPTLGFGVCRIDDLDECEKVVVQAIQSGYRLIDTAAVYHNEEAVGKAIQKCGVLREELFITTKLATTDNSYEGAMKGFYESIEKLQLDYIDLYLIHRPLGDYYGAYRALEELYEQGKIKSIGVSNFFEDRLIDLVKHCKVKPVVNQVQVHPFLQRKDEMNFINNLNIEVECWSPFAVGANNIFKNDVLTTIASKHNKSIAQVILRWHLQRGCIIIPKSVKKERMEENRNIFDFVLTNDEMYQISTLDVEQQRGMEDESTYRLASLKRVFHIEDEK